VHNNGTAPLQTEIACVRILTYIESRARNGVRTNAQDPIRGLLRMHRQTQGEHSHKTDRWVGRWCVWHHISPAYP